MFGFLNVNKPSGISSHKIISQLRHITGIKQIGHAGTLDPLASGVLPVAIGKAAKLIDYLPSDKSYIAGMYLGMTSDTFDTEGNIVKTEFRKINKEEIEAVLSQFRGKINQIPPAYSAVHYNGKRLYELARVGKIPDDIPSREVIIYKNEILDFDFDKQMLKLEISCSKGTYIRSIVNDIGGILGAGAVMFELTRTMSANMMLENAVNLDENYTKNDIERNLIPPQTVLPIKCIEINQNDFNKIINGNKIANSNQYCVKEALLFYNGKITALAEVSEDFIQPKKVLL